MNKAIQIGLFFTLGACSAKGGKNQKPKESTVVATVPIQNDSHTKAATPAAPPTKSPPTEASPQISANVRATEKLVSQSQHLLGRMDDLNWTRERVETELTAFGPPSFTEDNGLTRYWVICDAEKCSGLWVGVDKNEPEMIDDLEVLNEKKRDPDSMYSSLSLALWRKANDSKAPTSTPGPKELLAFGKVLNNKLKVLDHESEIEWHEVVNLFEQAGFSTSRLRKLEGEEHETRFFTVDKRSCVEMRVTLSSGSLSNAHTETHKVFARIYDNELYARCALTAIAHP